MSASSEPEWVIPSDIPFPDLTGGDLETCVYWLLDAMGARDLEWRQGSAGKGAADGGRDLEATLYQPDPEGELRPERWWIECKGRKGTLERQAVQNAAVNALGTSGLDVLVVVTNTTFSNPTRDWVSEFQRHHPKPIVRLWDKNTLERHLSQHPAVVSRLFSNALSPLGRLRAVQERFWNKLEFSPPAALSKLWEERANLDFDGFNGFALVVNEFASGSITERPWGGFWPTGLRLHTLHAGLLNTPYLLTRSHQLGIAKEPLIRALAYLLLTCIDACDPSALAELVLTSVRDRDGEALPDSVVQILLMPVLDQLLSEIRDVCSSDCRRIDQPPTTLRTEDGDEIADYWIRIRSGGKPKPNTPDRFLRLERLDAPCVVGFPCDKEVSCPIFQIEPNLDNIAELLTIIDRIITVRKAQTVPLAR